MENKFSKPLPSEIETKLKNADPEDVEKLVDEIFEIESFDDVRDILD